MTYLSLVDVAHQSHGDLQTGEMFLHLVDDCNSDFDHTVVDYIVVGIENYLMAC